MSKYTGQPSSRFNVNNIPVSMRGRSSSSQSGSVTSFSKDYEEFASLQLDKPLEGELKSSEEMKRHLFDDHFEGRPIERAMHLLAVGEEVQKLSVIRQLLQLIQADEQGCMQRVFPKIQQALNTASTEFHIETAKAFTTILEKRAISNHAFTQTFLPSILYHIDNRDQVVSNAWLDTLLEVSEMLPVDVIKHEVLHVAVNKGQISQSVWHRVSACKLLGKMCMRFDQHTVKKDILPVVHSLCQDVNESVRACICSQLHLVAKGLPAEMVKPALIPILVELGRDETVQVRVEATETIVHMIPFLSQDVLKITIIPLVKKICEQAVLAMDDTLIMVARQFGSLCLGLESCFSVSEKLWMVTYYHNMSHLGIPSHGAKKDIYFTSHNMDRLNARYIECRQLCAYNFPAMSKFCAPNPELLEKLYPSFCDFSTDPYYMVRKTIGCGMHEVARILGSNNRIVKNQVMTLLWDNMEEVLMGIIPHLGRTVDLLIASGVLGQEQDGATVEFGRGLLQCDKTIRDKTHNWRLYTDFITQLECIVKCLPSDYIYTHFVSLMFDKMHRARPLPCRLAAARTLLVFLRYNLKNNQRQEIRARIQAEFCMSSSCYKRMLFLRLCNIAREIFSRAYFKEHFFFLLLSRSEDKVANNRLLLVRQFPYLKAMIVMPNERKYLQTLETCIRNMAASEKDRDVTAELRLSIARLDKTETLNDTPNMPTLEDIEDKKKYEEEMKLANMIPRPGAAVGAMTSIDARRVAVKSVDRSATYASATANASRSVQQPGVSAPSRPVSHSASPSPSHPPSSSHTPTGSISYVNSPSVSSLSPVRTSYANPGGQAAVVTRKTATNFPDAASSNSSQISQQSFTNSANNYPLRTHLTHLDSDYQNCTCYSNFRSDNLRNLNLRALIDTSLENSNFKLQDNLRQKVTADVRSKIKSSCKSRMEMSWLNLETDLKNELVSLAKKRKVHGDRNFREKNLFLSDFRNFNESSLGKFINDDREKETIYNVRGDSNNCGLRANFLEEKINFFERKINLQKAKTNIRRGECTCIDLTTNKPRYFDRRGGKKFCNFSKSFEQDFYRDTGVRAHEVMGRKISGIPVSSPQMHSSAKLTNKRRTWFNYENSSQKEINLDTSYKFPTENGVRNHHRKKSETLPLPESVSLEKIGIGPRSKSFVLPETVKQSEKHGLNRQSMKLTFEKDLKLITGGLAKKNYFNSVNNLNVTNDKNKSGQSNGISKGNPVVIRKLGTESEGSRFGFRLKSRDRSPKTDTKSLPRTRIPIGRGSNYSNPNRSRSASPSLGSFLKDEEDGKGTAAKKIQSVIAGKTSTSTSASTSTPTPVQTSPQKINRRSLDSSKINITSMGKSPNRVTGRKNENVEDVNHTEVKEEKPDSEHVNNICCSKLPVRKSKPPEK